MRQIARLCRPGLWALDDVGAVALRACGARFRQGPTRPRDRVAFGGGSLSDIAASAPRAKCSGLWPQIRRCRGWSTRSLPISKPRRLRSGLARALAEESSGAVRFRAGRSQVIIGLDATLVSWHSENELAAPTFNAGLGSTRCSPLLLAFADHTGKPTPARICPKATDRVAGGELRQGSHAVLDQSWHNCPSRTRVGVLSRMTDRVRPDVLVCLASPALLDLCAPPPSIPLLPS